MWFSIFINAALKATVILTAAWAASLILRRHSAAARHLVWTAAAAALLALPFLSAGMPAVRFSTPASLAGSGAGLVFHAISLATADEPARKPAAPQLDAAPPAAAPGWARDARTWIAGVWLAGAALALLEMFLAYLRLSRLRSRAPRFRHADGTPALAAAMGIRHPVPVLEIAPGGMPMTFGCRRPVILMPAGAAEWSDERRRVVLLHELAHIRRGDAATHLLARAALSLYWWNPLAWMAWRQFLKERERAADDLVLHAGARASDYAGHLLEIASAIRPMPANSWAAVCMARRSHLEGRLLAILDGATDRRTFSRVTPVVAMLLAIAVVAPFAAMHAQDTTPQILAPEIQAAIAQKNHELLEKAAADALKTQQLDSAQKLLESALAIRGEVSGRQSAAYAAGLVKLGDLAVKRRQPQEAEAFYSKAVSLGESAETVPALIYLGLAELRRKNVEGAYDWFERAYVADSSGTRAGLALMWMASMRQRQGRGGDANSLYLQAISKLDADSPEAATVMELYAFFLREQARTDEAERFSTKAREVRQQIRANFSVTVPGPTAVRVGNGISAPKLIEKVEPEYSDEARAAKYQGTVLLYVEITPEGRATNIRIQRGLGLGLDEKAAEAVSMWKFNPATNQAGIPVTVSATIEVNFRLL